MTMISIMLLRQLLSTKIEKIEIMLLHVTAVVPMIDVGISIFFHLKFSPKYSAS